jgi:hypothetical protein
MAFYVTFETVRNIELKLKGVPWRCNKCRSESEILLKVNIDFDTLIICKKCLLEGRKLIISSEKELKELENEDDFIK